MLQKKDVFKRLNTSIILMWFSRLLHTKLNTQKLLFQIGGVIHELYQEPD